MIPIEIESFLISALGIAATALRAVSWQTVKAGTVNGLVTFKGVGVGSYRIVLFKGIYEVKQEAAVHVVMEHGPRYSSGCAIM